MAALRPFYQLAVLCMSLTAAVAVSVACGPSLEIAPTYPDVEHFSLPETVLPEGVDASEPPEDVLMPGDTVDLRIVSANITVSRGLIIGNDGTIPVDQAGQVRIAGSSLAEARELLQNELRRYDRFATPRLTLAEAGGRRVTMIGSVTKPGVYTASPGLRVADAIALANGLTVVSYNGEQQSDADIHAGRLIRAGETMPVSLALALQGHPRHNVHVYPGDMIWIPSMSNKRISVLGEVERAKSLRYQNGMRLTEALAIAGGTTIDADEADVRVVRGPLSEPRVYTASLSDVINGRASDVMLAPGDVVFVTEHWFATVTDVMRRLSPLIAVLAVGVALSN